MSHNQDEIERLQQSRQELVFANNDDRETTVQCLKTSFNLNEFGRQRVECLHANRFDRELIGHLVALLSSNLSMRHQEVEQLQAMLKESCAKREALEARIAELEREIDVHKDKNSEMARVLSYCGFTTAMKNCETLKAAMSLIKKEGKFSHLKAAVECFSTSPEIYDDNYFSSPVSPEPIQSIPSELHVLCQSPDSFASEHTDPLTMFTEHGVQFLEAHLKDC